MWLTGRSGSPALSKPNYDVSKWGFVGLKLLQEFFTNAKAGKTGVAGAGLLIALTMPPS